MTISLFAEAQQAEASRELAQRWTEENLSGLTSTRIEAAPGEVMVKAAGQPDEVTDAIRIGVLKPRPPERAIAQDKRQSIEQRQNCDPDEPAGQGASGSGGQVSGGLGGLGGGQAGSSHAGKGHGSGNEGGKVGRSQEDNGGGVARRRERRLRRQMSWAARAARRHE